MGYAESDDGVAWRKRTLGICPYGAASHLTNLGFHSPSVFVDPEARASERYRATGYAHPQIHGCPAGTPDGDITPRTPPTGSRGPSTLRLPHGPVPDVITSVYHPGSTAGDRRAEVQSALPRHPAPGRCGRPSDTTVRGPLRGARSCPTTSTTSPPPRAAARAATTTAWPCSPPVAPRSDSSGTSATPCPAPPLPAPSRGSLRCNLGVPRVPGGRAGLLAARSREVRLRAGRFFPVGQGRRVHRFDAGRGRRRAPSVPLRRVPDPRLVPQQLLAGPGQMEARPRRRGDRADQLRGVAAVAPLRVPGRPRRDHGAPPRAHRGPLAAVPELRVRGRRQRAHRGGGHG